MTTTRQIEIFSAGCPVCEETIALVNRIVCGNCEVTVHDMRKPESARRAGALGVRSVPAVAVNGTLASCCSSRGVEEAALRAAGIGQGSASQ
jgi:glutaredoxin 3